MENGTKEKKAPVPYISWKTFTSFLGNMKGKLPEQIDTSVLTNMSGTARSQLLSALRFLDLIATDGTVKDGLKRLSEAHGTLKWKDELSSFLKRAYAPVIADLNIGAATPAMLRDRFKNLGDVEGTTIDNAIRFYISGLKEAEVSFSPHLAVRASRGSGGSRRRASGISRTGYSEEASEADELPEGTFHIPFDLLGVPKALLQLPEEIDCDQWKAMSDYVLSVIGYRQRTRKAGP